jgi:hypothetical protein
MPYYFTIFSACISCSSFYSTLAETTFYFTAEGVLPAVSVYSALGFIDVSSFSNFLAFVK